MHALTVVQKVKSPNVCGVWYLLCTKCLKKSHLSCIPNVIIWGDEAIEKKLGREGRTLMNGIAALLRRDKRAPPAPCFALYHMSTQQKGGCLQTRKVLHWNPTTWDHDLKFPTSRATINKR